MAIERKDEHGTVFVCVWPECGRRVLIDAAGTPRTLTAGDVLSRHRGSTWPGLALGIAVAQDAPEPTLNPAWGEAVAAADAGVTRE